LNELVISKKILSYWTLPRTALGQIDIEIQHQPKVPTSTQETSSAVSRHAFFPEVESLLKDDSRFNPSRCRWLFDFSNVLNTSPTRTSIDNWVVELAEMQAVIPADFFLNRATSIFLQCNGGHDGKEVKMLTGWDPSDKADTPGGSVRQVLLDVDAAGKKAVKLAEGMDVSLSKVGITRECGKRLDGLVVDSGAGTPEPLKRGLVDVDRMTAEGFDNLRGLHECQSVFRLAMQHHIGDGGLGKRNAVQCNHAVFLKCLLDSRNTWDTGEILSPNFTIKSTRASKCQTN
jgi:hypothetical protein